MLDGPQAKDGPYCKTVLGEYVAVKDPDAAGGRQQAGTGPAAEQLQQDWERTGMCLAALPATSSPTSRSGAILPINATANVARRLSEPGSSATASSLSVSGHATHNAQRIVP